MASSDKNAHHSRTSGSSTQPAQPVGEAESSQVAGQLLKSLKDGSGARPAVSHEAKLGMMVITILVFAFCFLVYHKMDIYQQQLTQASIPSTAGSAAGAVAGADVTATAGPGLGTTQQDPAADPLLHADKLSGEMQIAAGEITFDEVTALAEPVLDQNDPDQQSAFLVPQGTQPDSSTELALSDLQLDGMADPGFGRSQESPGEPTSTESSGEADSEIVFDAAEEPGLTELQPTTVETPNDDSRSAELISQGSSEFIAENQVSDFSGVSSVQASGDAGISADSKISASTESEQQNSEFADAGSEQTSEEPMLLAMAESAPGAAFADGFGSTSVSSDNEVRAGSDVSETEISFSAVESADTRMALAAQDRSSLGPGFDAVARPSSRTGNRNPIRTAAGSGADGKFSLAAFNYQNNSAEPAPDDGTTFDSTRVQDGENYTTISKRVYGSGRYFSALAVFNQHRIPEPKKMRPGMLVLTPPVDVLVARYPQLFEDLHSKVVEPAEFLILEDNSPAYRVGERETLSEISERFLGRSARWVEIYRLNQSIVNDPNKLKPGTILALPADAVEVNVKP